MSLRVCALAGFLLVAQPSSGAEPAPPPPPYVGAYQPHGVDEIGFWQREDESERKLAASPLVIRDEKLNSYVKSVLCEAVGDDRCSAARIYIMREPTFQATMAPNGTMRVFSGLLLRMRSEAELAAVLGHEFGHFERRHTVNIFKAQRSGTDLLAWAGVLASMSYSYDVRRTYQNLELSVYGDLFRFGRDQEREADMLGIGYLNASSLRPQSASEVWQNLMGEIEASAQVRGLRKPDFKAIAFTASHPPEAERAGYLTALAAPTASGRDDGATAYREAMKPWVPLFLEDQIKLNDFGASEYIIGRLSEQGWTPDLWFARAELYRTRGNQRDLTHAVEYYKDAIELDPTMAAAFRGLGLSLLKLNAPTEGREALHEYLRLSPDAADAGMIKMMVPE